jgi:hypothetical protein
VYTTSPPIIKHTNQYQTIQSNASSLAVITITKIEIDRKLPEYNAILYSLYRVFYIQNIKANSNKLWNFTIDNCKKFFGIEFKSKKVLKDVGQSLREDVKLEGLQEFCKQPGVISAINFELNKQYHARKTAIQTATIIPIQSETKSTSSIYSPSQSSNRSCSISLSDSNQSSSSTTNIGSLQQIVSQQVAAQLTPMISQLQQTSKQTNELLGEILAVLNLIHQKHSYFQEDVKHSFDTISTQLTGLHKVGFVETSAKSIQIYSQIISIPFFN